METDETYLLPYFRTIQSNLLRVADATVGPIVVPASSPPKEYLPFAVRVPADVVRNAVTLPLSGCSTGRRVISSKVCDKEGSGNGIVRPGDTFGKHEDLDRVAEMTNMVSKSVLLNMNSRPYISWRNISCRFYQQHCRWKSTL